MTALGWTIICMMYSKRPKSGRPDFGVFEKRPVPKRPVFRRSFENRTFISGFQTSGSIYFRSPVIGRPVLTSDNRTFSFENRKLYPVFRRFGTGLEPVLVPKRLKTG